MEQRQVFFGQDFLSFLLAEVSSYVYNHEAQM